MDKLAAIEILHINHHQSYRTPTHQQLQGMTLKTFQKQIRKQASKLVITKMVLSLKLALANVMCWEVSF